MKEVTPSPSSSTISGNSSKRHQAKRFGALTMVPLTAVFALLFLFWNLNPLTLFAQTGITRYATPNGSGDCLTPATPCTLQTAVSDSDNDDEVLASSGTYPSLRITRSITISGGFITPTWAVREPALNPSIIDGNATNNAITIDNSASPIIDGFHIQNGSGANGAGILVNSGNPTIQNNWIHDNVATTQGGGIFIANGQSATIQNNEIYDNQAPAGAGILVSFGGANATVLFNNIYNNDATSGAANGGGVYVVSSSSAFLEGNQIYGNNSGLGGGLYAGGTITAVNNMLFDNTAIDGGAAHVFGNLISWNNTVAGNSATTNGGGFLIFGSAQISNTIVVSNTAGSGTSGIHDSSGGGITGDYNNIFGNNTDVTFPTTISDDPEFINYSLFNLHLSQISPNIDQGDPLTSPSIDRDIDRQARPNPDGTDPNRVDIGADEFYASIPAFSLTPPFQESFEDRGTVATYSHFLANLNTTDPDTYVFTCDNDQSWAVGCPLDQSLAVGEAISVSTQITIPGSANALAVANTIITATSTLSPALKHAVAVRTIVNPNPGLQFTPNISRTAAPGEIITLTHRITNTGDAPDVFRITIDSDDFGWAEIIPNEPLTVPLGINASTNVRVRISVPPSAAAIIPNVTQIRATSSYDVDTFALVTDTVRALETIGTRFVSQSGTDFNNNCTQSTFPCQTVTHAIEQAVTNDEVRIAWNNPIQPYALNDEVQINETIHVSGRWLLNFSEQSEDEGQQTIIAGDGDSRLFALTGAANTSSFDGLILIDGANDAGRGGAINIGSNVQAAFNDVTIQSSQASRGGAVNIQSNGFARFDRSHFISNTASLVGGAIHVDGGSLVIRQSTFSENGSNSDGGAVYVLNGSINSENNLFNLNTAIDDGGAVYIENNIAGSSDVNHNTFVNNTADQGGGIYVSTPSQAMNLVNSIFADNTANAGSAFFANSGTVNSDFVNLWNDNTAGSGTINTSNPFNVDPSFADPEFRLAPTSLLVDARGRNEGNQADELDVDFEDDGRPSDQGYDLGYDELAGCTVKRDDTIYGSIQEAIDDPAGVSNQILVSGICRGVHALTIGGNTIQQTVHLTGTQEFIIQGGWEPEFEDRLVEETTIIDPQGLGRAFFISGPVSVTLEYLTIVNGDATGLQGGPSNEDAGGNIFNNGGQVTLRAVSILTGTAELGGGYFNLTGNTEVGLVVAAEPEFEMDPNDLEVALTSAAVANTAVNDGGAFYNSAGTIHIDSTYVMSNTAVNGAGIYNDTGVLTATNTVLAFNNASSDGAGVYNASPAATNLLHLTLYDNDASSDGGGIFIEAGLPTAVRSNIFQDNQASSGQALFAPATIANDFNYYNGQASPFGGGVSIGSNSTNSSTPPGLIDPANGDFHLQNTAPAADMGDPTSPVDHDFDEDPRPSNQGPDAGADEIAGCRAELNGTIYGSIQAAMEDAQTGDTIRVSGICSGVHDYDTGGPAGGCRGNAADAGIIQTTVHIDKNVILQGGWNDDFTEQGEEITILDAMGLGRVIYIAPTITATVETFHIINGSLSGANRNGAGICIDNATPTIRDNEIISNTATNGGGIYAINSGGTIDGNRIYQNASASNGGGIYANAGDLSIWNNFVYSNTASTNGGGLASLSGDHRIWHNTLVGNQAGNQGAGVYISSAGSPEIINSVFMNNDGPNTDGIFSLAGSSPTVDFNDYFGQDDDLGGTAVDGGNSLTVDPLFTTSAYTLTFASPLVDAGDPAMTLDHDFEDDIRPSHLGFDIGADEIGGCFARNTADPNSIYGSVQLAVDLAANGDTIEVDGVCRNAKARQNSGGTDVTQNLFIDKEITIDGDWISNLHSNTQMTATLDALTNGRVVYIDSSGVLTLTNIQLVNGVGNGAGINNHGGGIYNDGQLVLDGVDVQGNTAVNGGGIYNAADLTMIGSHIFENSGQNGGGLYNNTANTANIIENNRFNNNVAANNGGGVYQNAGTLLLDGNRIYQNIADNNGGGVHLAGGSGASVNVRNNFIYRNLAQLGGGLYNQVANSGIWHNTIYRNNGQNNIGGGIYSSGAAVIHSNIVDSNFGSGIHTGVSTNIDYNNVVDNLANSVPANYSGSASAGANDISIPPDYIDPLQDDFHLFSFSAGVDDGDPNLTFDNDYDGDLRPTNGGPDRGADEINSCLIRVTDPTDSNPDTMHHIFGVLQDAIDFAETPAFGPNFPTVEIARGECSGTKQDASTGFYQVGSIREDLVFEGSLRRFDFQYVNDYTSDEVDTVSSVINAQGDGRVIYIHDGADPYFNHLAFVEGNAAQSGDPTPNGGGINIAGAGSIRMEESFICDSSATAGGGLYVPGSATPLPGENIYISGASIGICLTANVIENPDNGAIDDVIYRLHDGNSASSNGGGAYIDGDFHITNAVFWGNNTSGNGGGLYNTNNNLLIINGIFYSNTASLSGGAVFNTGANLEMYHNTLRENFANGGNGGGIRNQGSGYILNSSILYGNEASGTGGGLSSSTGATLGFNSYYDNQPNHTDTGGTGSNAQFIAQDDLIVIYPAIDSPVIDTADPLLLNPGPASYGEPIDFDADLIIRPDGGTIHLGDTGSDRGAYEWNKDFGCTVTPTPQQATLSPGNNDAFYFTVTNTGWPLPPTDEASGFIDTITVTLHSSTSGWTALQGGNQQVFTDMYWYESVPITLTVQVPTNATTGMSDITLVRCQSSSMPTRFSDGQATTNVGLVSGLIVYPSRSGSGTPGEVLTFTHTVQNVGNETTDVVIRPDAGDQFASAVLLDGGGGAITETFVTLDPNETIDVVLEVTLLDTAVPGEFANPGVVAAEVGNEAENNGSVLDSVLILNEPGTRHVAVGGQDTTNCTDPTNPCGTIQWAVDVAFEADNILVASGNYTNTVTRTINTEVYEQNVYLDKSVTIRGGYSTQTDFTTQYPITQATHLNGEGAHRVIYAEPGITVTLSSLFIENGDANNQGDNEYGGGIYNLGADLTITGTWIYSNSAKYGGGLFQFDGPLQSDSSVFAFNDTENLSGVSGIGAGAYISNSTAVFENNTFVGNDTNSGDSNPNSTAGAIYMDNGTFTSINNIFSDNEASISSAVYISAPVSVITSNYNLYWNNNINIITGTNSLVADPDFTDTYYHIAATSPAKDAGTETRTLTATTDFDLEPRVMGTTIDIGADERLQRPNFTFTPITATAAITASTLYTYEFVLQNTGDSVDSYAISMSNQSIPAGGNWSYNLQPTTITDLALNTAVTVTFEISGSNPGFIDHTILTATTTNLAQPIVRSVEATTTITFTPGVNIEMSQTGVGTPGVATDYTHVLTNTGDGTDRFEIRVSGVVTNPPLAGWSVTINPTQTGYIGPNAMVPFTVSVTPPAGAPPGAVHTVTVEALSLNMLGIDARDTLTDVTTVEEARGWLFIPDFQAQTVPDGTVVTYTHTLQNIGNVSDSATLTVTGTPDTWLVTIDPLNTPLLAPLESIPVTVTVTVPDNTGGLVHTAVLSATSDSDPLATGTAVDETTVQTIYGVQVEPDITRTVDANTTVMYTHTITNSGNAPDVYTITVQSTLTWTTTATPGPIALDPGMTDTITVTVIVPPNAEPDFPNTTIVTATSQADPAVFDTAVDTTRIRQIHSLIFIQDETGVADPGTNITYTHWLTNTGNGTDRFSFTAVTPNNWVTAVPGEIVLGPGIGSSVVVTLTVPNGAAGRSEVMTVTATSVISPAISASVVDTTTVTGRPGTILVDIEPDNNGLGNPGDTVIYTHTVTNTGTITEDFVLTTLSENGWVSGVNPTTLLLTPSESTQVMVTTTIPITAPNNATDTLTVTVTSQTDANVSDSALDTTTVGLLRGVIIEPDRTGAGNAGDTVTYMHTVTNTGNAADTFSITTDSSNGWLTPDPPQVTVGAGLTSTVVVTLIIPIGAPTTTDIMTVVATSINDAAVTDTAVDTTNVTGVSGTRSVLIEPDNNDTGQPGATVDYNHIITNTGTVADDFRLTVASSQGWSFVSTPASGDIIRLNPNETANVTIRVTIPTNATVGLIDVTTITVQSLSDGSVSDVARDTTTVVSGQPTQPTVYLPVIMNSTGGTTPPTPTPTPTATPCVPTTGVDLVVTQLQVLPISPSSGTPATVYVTIRNQGSVDVTYGNNFFLDFYVDRQPQPYLVGDIVWGIQGGDLTAGTSQIYSAPYTFSGGSHQLYAQVDTDQHVNECPNENNNTFGPVNVTVSGAVNHAQEQVVPQFGPRETPPPDPPEGSESTATSTSLPTMTPTPLNTAVSTEIPATEEVEVEVTPTIAPAPAVTATPTP